MTDRIKPLREARGWSQRELAARSKLRGGSSIWEIEAGRGNPTLRTLEAIAEALGVPVLELFSDPGLDPTTEELMHRLKGLSPDKKAAYLKIIPRRHEAD